MNHLFRAFYNFYSAIPLVKGEDNTKTSTMAGVSIMVLMNVLSVVEFVFGGSCDAEQMLIIYGISFASVFFSLFFYFDDDRMNHIIKEYNDRSYSVILAVYVLVSIGILLFLIKMS